jgi:pimeloyl-ACP methyl ester carboxylesterase
MIGISGIRLVASECHRMRQPTCAKVENEMSRTTAIAVLACALATASVPEASNAEEGKMSMKATPATTAPSQAGRAEIAGVNYYYEVRGQGEPLLLLHGGLGSIDMFAPILPALSKDRQIIAVDLHGHGRTPLGSRNINLVDIGNDLAALLKRLGYGKVDVLGYSFGGGAAFRLAVQHPEAVRRLVLVSAGYAQDGFFPELRAQQVQVGAAMADLMKDTPMYKSYAAVAPHPEDFPKLLDQMGNLMRTPYDYSADVATLKMPVMLVFGDSDMYRLEHVAKFYQLLGGGLRDAGWMREGMSQNRLAIIPNRTHYDMFFAPELVPTVLPFLNGQTQVKSWAEHVGEK